MSKLTTCILSAIALSLSSGVAELALGRDLPEPTDEQSAAGINRAAKADRIVAGAGPAQTQTISLQLDGFSATSFLVRVPVASGKDNPSSRPSASKPRGGRPMVACEPVVSLLTEVAKLLQPGRCVT
jgi:hypothetical protein